MFRPCPRVFFFMETFLTIFEKIRVRTRLHALQGMRSMMCDIIVFESAFHTKTVSWRFKKKITLGTAFESLRFLEKKFPIFKNIPQV